MSVEHFALVLEELAVRSGRLVAGKAGFVHRAVLVVIEEEHVVQDNFGHFEVVRLVALELLEAVELVALEPDTVVLTAGLYTVIQTEEPDMIVVEVSFDKAEV